MTMTEHHRGLANQAVQLLKKNLSSYRDGSEPVWNTTWPVFERLIARHHEMKPVYTELEEKKLSGQSLWTLLDMIIMTAAFNTDEESATLRDEYLELQKTNKEISQIASRLVTLLRRRGVILNSSGSFSVDHFCRLTDYIDHAAQDNGLYRSYIQPRLAELDNFDLKYWPELADVMQVLADESREVQFRDETSAAIVGARRASQTDFFMEFFSRLHEISDSSTWGLPCGFRLSDSSVATLFNISSGCSADEVKDAEYVRRLRQRLREKGLTGVW